LIAWEGDKTLTFTVTDALISPVSLSMLSGAGLVKEAGKRVHVHATTAATMVVSTDGSGAGATKTGIIDLTDALTDFGVLSINDGVDGGVTVDAGSDAPLFIIKTEDDGSITGDIVTSTPSGQAQADIKYEVTLDSAGTKVIKAVLSIPNPKWNNDKDIESSVNVLVDYYVVKAAENVSEIQVTAEDFAGYYYVEADTLFRSQSTGIDMPANLTFPNVKVQSGFTIAMAGTGDPSTFDFTMDAFPGYTYFDKSRKVLCVIQVVEDSQAGISVGHSVMISNNTIEHEDPMKGDSDQYNIVG
jgi:hypothetical protein